MANNLSFTVRLELLADKFRQKAEGAMNALRGIQFQAIAMAGALGAGISSLSGLFSSLVSTAREAGRARTTLRNVSADAREYGQSLRFVSELSNKYGTDLIGLTEAFAKFKAAATPAGVAVAEQERIFANISKAMTSFGISGGEATLTMAAITQMMGKGKISSEELRQQLGERIPVAMQAMANAAGVSIGQLDKLLKEGKLRSSDIMGKFSDELAKLSGETSTDNLEASLGRLKNAFSDLADALRIGDHFKRAVDIVKGLLEYLRTHLSNFYIWAGALLAGKLWGKFSNAWSEAGAAIRASQAQAIADDARAKSIAQKAKSDAEKALHSAQEKVARAEAALEKASAPTRSEANRIVKAQTSGDKGFSSAVANLSKAQAEYRQLTALHQSYLRGLEASELEVAKRLAVAKQTLANAHTGGDAKTISEAKMTYDKVLAEASRLHARNTAIREQAEIRYAFKADELQKKIAISGQALNEAQYRRRELLAEAHSKNEEQRQKRLASLQATLDRERAALAARATSVPTSAGSMSGVGNAQRATQFAGQLSFQRQSASIVASQEQAAVSTVSLWTRTTATFRVLWASAVATVRSLLSTLVPMAIIGAITAVVTAMVDWYNKQKEINGLQDQYLAKQKALTSTRGDEAIQILRLFDLYKSLHGKLDEQKTVQHQLERSLGLQEGSLDRIAGKYDQIRSIVDKIVQLKDIDRQIDFYSETSKDSRKPQQELYEYHLERGGKTLSADQQSAVRGVIARYATATKEEMTAWMRETYARVGSSWDPAKDRAALLNTIHHSLRGSWATKAEQSFYYSAAKKGNTFSDLKDAGTRAFIGQDAEAKIQELQVKRLHVEGEANAAVKEIGGRFQGQGSTAGSGEEDKKGKKSDLERAREAAAKDLQEVENKRTAQLYKSTDDYRLALDKVAQTHTERLASLLGARSLEDEQYKRLQGLLLTDRDLIEEKQRSATELRALSAKVSAGIASEDDLRNARADRAKAELSALIASGREFDASDAYVQARLSEIAEVSAIASLQREYTHQTKILTLERAEGVLSEKEYHKALAELIASTRRKIVSTETSTSGEEIRKSQLSEELQSDLQKLTPSLLPSRKSRDTTLDYKKTELDKRKDEKELLDEYIGQLEKAQKAGLEVGEALQKAQAEAKTLGQAVKLAELSEDLKKYQKAIADKTLSGIKTVAQSARNLKSAFDSLKKAFDPDESASAWERFFAVFDSASQGIDTILSLVSMVQELTKARETAAAVEQALTAQKIAQTTAVTTAETTSTATEVGLSATRTAATTIETKADTIGAAAKVAKAHAALPFVGVAIAGAMIGALIATIASSANKVPKFASGGIVPGGDGSGDRVLARVNPGELILNKAQQGRLANHLTSTSALRVEIEGRIRARDILQLSTVATRHKTR